MDEAAVGRISRERKEPFWLRDSRINAVRAFNRSRFSPEQARLLEKALPECLRVLSGREARRGGERAARSLGARGVVFCGLREAVSLRPELLRRFLGSTGASVESLAAFNAALWSDGVFLHVPKGVEIAHPVQSELLRRPTFSPVERILIVAGEKARAHFLEGCTARQGAGVSRVSLVELVALRGSRLRFTTLQNLPRTMDNLTVKRASVAENASLSWIDVNVGARGNLKRPEIFLAGRGSSAEVLSCAAAGPDCREELGARFNFEAPRSAALFNSWVVVFAGGQAKTRVEVGRGTAGKCASLKARSRMMTLDAPSRAAAVLPAPGMRGGLSVQCGRSSSRIDSKRLFYMMSRGLDRARAAALLVNGFLEPVARELPLEFAVEFNRMVEIELAEALGP